MQKKRSKNLRKNIGKIWKMWHAKNMRKQHSNEENFQGGLRRRNYTGGQTSGMTRNIGVGWREIGDDGSAGDP